jgi:hypothetical protein
MYQKIQGLKDWKEDISNQEKVTLKCLDHNFEKFELKQGIFELKQGNVAGQCYELNDLSTPK